MPLSLSIEPDVNDKWDDIQFLEDEDIEGVHTPLKQTSEQVGTLLGSGAFGQVYRVTPDLCIKRGVWSNRLMVPSCSTIMDLSKRILTLFPIHFPAIFACTASEGPRIRYEISMQCINNAIPFREYIRDNPLRSTSTMTGLYAQMFYITRVLNDASIFHNDFDVRNILIGTTKQSSIRFDQDDSWTMIVSNVPYVFIIDLDFVGSTFTNDKDCIRLGSSRDDVRCTRDIDTLETNTRMIAQFSNVWDIGVSTTIDTVQFIHRPSASEPRCGAGCTHGKATRARIHHRPSPYPPPSTLRPMRHTQNRLDTGAFRG
jgi:hypothetical protein